MVQKSEKAWFQCEDHFLLFLHLLLLLPPLFFLLLPLLLCLSSSPSSSMSFFFSSFSPSSSPPPSSSSSFSLSLSLSCYPKSTRYASIAKWPTSESVITIFFVRTSFFPCWILPCAFNHFMTSTVVGGRHHICWVSKIHNVTTECSGSQANQMWHVMWVHVYV